jgi:hypothetical protein
MSRYLNPHVARERLRDEWNKYGSLIVAYDVDSTVLPYHATEADDNYEPIRQLLKDLQALGCTLIAFTAASEDRWHLIKDELTRLGISFDYFNESPDNIPGVVRRGKVYANAYLDDRAGLNEVFTALFWLVAEKKKEAAETKAITIAKQLANL